METTKSRLNKYSQTISSVNDLKDLLLQGKSINNLLIEDNEDIKLFKEYQLDLLSTPITFLEQENLSINEFHEKYSNQWLIPDNYKQIDVREWLLFKCKTQEEIDRVSKEYKMYEERNLIMLLRSFIFLIDYLRQNKFIWGVGRGSSTNSYILYLIGTHRVNSIFYKLPIKDFLK